MGKTATQAFVMAQLYTPDGECHGLHGFVIPIRNPSTMLTYPGVTIFDMGEKIGLNGLDNGVMIFDNYAVGRECLLSKTGNITPDGRYVSAYKDPNKRFGASLGNLSAARTGIVQFCAANMCSALAIAIRYSAVRRQFGNAGEQELPVIEYQMQQWRLFPYLAAAYVMKFVGDQIYQNFVTFAMSQFNPDISKDTLATMGI
ncbi:Peroxisomal acyl-coenzyme A oxidase 3, partial [Orchesella cincta]